MRFVIQLAKATRQVADKGEDRSFKFVLKRDECFLIGVADGISRANGEAAARWIEETMRCISNELGAEALGARQLCDRFLELLHEAHEGTRLSDSCSTLSCGIGRLEQSGRSTYIRFDFFGIGDSPIWRVTPCNVGGLVFQASPVYSPPVPSEQANVYSSVNLGQGRIDGMIHFGSVDVNESELLIVATDGLPESRILYDDQDPARNERSPQLIASLLRSKCFDDATLNDAIAEYDTHRLLIDDDASLVVARLISVPLPVEDDLDELQQTEASRASLSPEQLPGQEAGFRLYAAGNGEADGAAAVSAESRPPSSESAAARKGEFDSNGDLLGLPGAVERVLTSPGGEESLRSASKPAMTPRTVESTSSKEIEDQGKSMRKAPPKVPGKRKGLNPKQLGQRGPKR